MAVEALDGDESVGQACAGDEPGTQQGTLCGTVSEQREAGPGDSSEDHLSTAPPLEEIIFPPPPPPQAKEGGLRRPALVSLGIVVTSLCMASTLAFTVVQTHRQTPPGATERGVRAETVPSVPGASDQLAEMSPLGSGRESEADDSLSLLPAGPDVEGCPADTSYGEGHQSSLGPYRAVGKARWRQHRGRKAGWRYRGPGGTAGPNAGRVANLVDGVMADSADGVEAGDDIPATPPRFDIARVLRRAAPHVARCGQRAGEESPLVVDVTINGPTGRVSSVGVRQGSPTVVACVNQALAESRFRPFTDNEFTVAGFPFVVP